MSLPSVAKDKTSNKISLVTRPSVTLVQPVQVIGTSASQSQPTLIYVQSLQPSSQQQQQHKQPVFIGPNQVNQRKTFSQPISIISSKTIRTPKFDKTISLPSTSNRVHTSISIPNRVQTIHLKSNVTTAPSIQQPTLVNQTVNVARSTVSFEKAKLTKLKPIRSVPTATTTATATTTTTTQPQIKNVATVEKSASISIASNHKTIVPHATKTDPVKYRYRTILENLLQLKNNFVRRTITQAIQQKLCNQSNEDLLNVIFRSFELTLLSVNVEQIHLNETYLNATLAFLAKVIETGRFMELIENRKETKDIRKFVTADMSTILNKVSLESVYKNAREIFDQKQRGSYAQILELLNKVISLVRTSPDTKLSSTEIEFWLRDVMPLIFDSDEDIQSNAIEAVSKVVPLLITSRHQSHPHWTQVRNTILTEYTQKISSCFLHGNAKWHLVWCLCVRLLDVDIPRSASTLNAFLSIVEPALRSNVPIRRAEGYLCWRVLLEVLVRHNRLNTEKRLKLMCTPLKSLQAKTLEIARNKFQAWWYVLCNVQENVENYISMVFEPFLQFCFGQLFPAPNLRICPSESATQVKSFPNVSLMAICTLLRMLDGSDKQLDELFTKFSLIQPSHFILTETIFGRASTAALVINACGEATIMLNNLKNDANNNIDCTTLAVCMWTRLFKHVNQAKNPEHINLILDNTLQLVTISLNINNSSSYKMLALVYASILDHVNASFIFEPMENGVISENVSKSVAKYLDVVIRLPKNQWRFEALLSKLLATPVQDVEQFYENFTNFLTIIDEQFFKTNVRPTELVTTQSDLPMMCCQFINCILSYIQLNADAFKEIRSNASIMRIPQIFFNIIYWPLSFSLSKNDFDMYTKTLLKTIDILLTMINKPDFCKQSAIIVRNIIAKPNHCIYINDAIAMLFDYMVYDFDDLKGAPVDMLNLCALVIRKDSKIVFQDLNSIAEALIKYRRAISQKQFEIITSKLRDIVKLIENEKSNMRTELSLIKDLKELVGDEIKMEKSPGSKSLRSSKNKSAEKDEFVVVNKVWKLEPNKLTEHQREKMKTRRCDIPALYNDLSQSQDSYSIQEWSTPKSTAKSLSAPKIESIDEKNTSNTMIEPTNTANEQSNTANEQTNESTVSQRAKKSEKGAKSSPKRSYSNQSQSQTDETSDEVHNTKRRVNRELNRIQIDAKVEEVPYSNLTESNRLTRSTLKKIEDKPDEKRKTRSDSVKTVDLSVKEMKKKPARTSLANSPLPKKKAKFNEKVMNTAESEPSTEQSTPRRRLTRQSKTEESDHDDSIDEVKTDSNKMENKKTEFVDTLELKVEKLPLNLAQTSTENTEHVEETEQILVETCTESESEIRNKAQIPSKNETIAEDLVPKLNDDQVKYTNMDVDEVSDVKPKETVPTEENKENLEINSEPINEAVDQPMNVQTEEQPKENTENEFEQSSQVLVETATMPNGNEPTLANVAAENSVNPSDEQLVANSSDNENEISSRSYMSALVFDGISPSKSLNGSTIVTSPEIDAPRSIEFLNDTLNISPITSNSAKNEEISCDQVKKKIITDDLEGIERMEESLVQDKKDTEQAIVANDVTNEKESTDKKDVENDASKNAPSAVAAATVFESPVVPSSKQVKTALTMQSSTPIQSHHSPVSSKFKTQLLGRGAQLLKMINSNKSPKPASPTPNSMHDNALKSVSPTINQLETAPICENIVSTPEPKSSRERQLKHEQNENGNFLTLSGALPSPYESPGISILKRKCSNISMDDSMHSPAPKRKRVSFGFPLSQTKEYIIDDQDFTPFYMIPTNDSPCRRANRLKKLKVKRNKFHNESAKISTNDTKPIQTTEDIEKNDVVPINEPAVPGKDDVVSVKCIQEYLGMDIQMYRSKQEKQLADGNAENASKVEEKARESNSDDSSTESNDDDPEFEATGASTSHPSTAKSIADFSDEAIIEHLLTKYTPNDILKKFETTIDAKILTKRLSSMMSSDKQIESSVLEELAEKHSESFLEHAITENLCSVICDRLSSKSSNGINDYFADKINADEQFACDFLDRVSVSVLRQKLMDIITTSKREQHILLEDFLVALKDYISSTHRTSQRTVDSGVLPEHIHLWIAKLFDQFKLTPEQYLQLTSIYIHRNPPTTLDHFD